MHHQQPSPRRRASHRRLDIAAPAVLRRRAHALMEALDPRVLLTAAGPGLLDPAFGSGGIALYDTPASDTFNAAAADPQGRVVAVGQTSTSFGSGGAIVARFDSSGNLDPAFGTNGVTTYDPGSPQESFQAVATAADGSVIAVGTTDSTGLSPLLVARFDPNGLLDTSFGSNGTVSAFLPGAQTGNVHVHGVTILPNGSILFAGDATATSDSLPHDFVARLTPAGSYDATFAPSHTGVSFASNPNNGDEALSVAFQGDGKILVGGDNFNGTANPGRIVRFNPDGSLDTSFGAAGIVTLSPGSFASINALAVGPDGRIVAAGLDASESSVLYRLSSTGALDPTFGAAGAVPATAASGVPAAVYVEPNNQIVLADSAGHTFKFSAAGHVDTGWGGDITGFTGIASSGYTLLAGPVPGDLLLAGLYPVDAGAAALAAIGNPTDTTAPNATVNVAVQPTVGAPTFDFYVIYSDNEGVDPTSLASSLTVSGSTNRGATSSTATLLSTVPVSPNAVSALYRMPAPGGAWTAADAGSYLVNLPPAAARDFAGNASAAGFAGAFTFNPAGAFDPSFGYTGRSVAPVDAGGALNAISIAPDGQIVGIGSSTGSGGNDLALDNLMPNGDPNAVYTTTYHDPDSQDSPGYAALRLPNGQLLVAGQIGSQMALWRYNPDNSLDTSFNEGQGFLTVDFSTYFDSGSVDASAHAVAVDPSTGNIYLVGTASDFSQGTESIAIARALPNGFIDSSFGSNGVTTVATGSNFISANAAVLDSQGNLVIAAVDDAGSPPQGEILRTRPDGSLDSTFGIEGVVTLGQIGPDALALRPDDSVVFAGQDLQFGGAVVGRVDPTGSTDAAFAHAIPAMSGAYAIAAEPDGSFIIAGSSTTTSQFAAAHILPTGAPDAAFAAGQTVAVVPFLTGSSYANAVAIQPDGRIVLAGSANNIQAFARLTPQGLIDPTFGSPGRTGGLTLGSGGSDSVVATVVQSDGKTLLAGAENGDFLLFRLNTDGSLDTSFGSGGIVLFSDGGQSVFQSLSVLPNGKILAAGSAFTGQVGSDFVLYRFNPDGSIDTSFAQAGAATVDFNGNSDDASTMLLLGDPNNPRIILGGFAYDPSGTQTSFALAAVNPDGSLDTSFGNAGKVLTSLGTDSSSVQALALSHDGSRIVAIGDAFNGQDGFAIAEYTLAGARDMNFASGAGSVFFSPQPSQDASAVGGAVTPDGHILVGGNLSMPDGYEPLVARFNPDGSLDTSFGAAGTGFVTPLATPFTPKSFLLDPAGHIYLGGSGFSVARLNPDGSLDLAWGNAGLTQQYDAFTPVSFNNLAARPFTPFDDSISALALAPDGTLVAAGIVEGDNFNLVLAAARYLTASPKPDLAIADLTTFPSSPLLPGQTLTGIGGTLVNFGTAPAFTPTVGLYLSADPVFGDADDILLGFVPASQVFAASSSAFSFPVSLPSSLPAGAYHLFAVADPNNAIAESNESNNATQGPDVTIAPPLPDLAVSSLSSDSTATAGSPFNLNVGILNLGAGVPSLSVNFYLSTDTIFGNADDILLGAGGFSIPNGSALQPIITSTFSFTLSPTTPAGAYHLIAVVDPNNLVAESNESNNVFVAATTVQITNALPNLTPTAVSYNPATTQGGVFTITPIVRDTSTSGAPSVPVNFYLSTDTIFGNADDVLLGSATYPAVAAGQTDTLPPFSVPIPANLSPGTYYVLTVTDPNNVISESNENDNVLVSSPITVTAPTTPPTSRPDLFVSFVDFIPGDYTAGSSTFTFTPTIGNAGSVTSPATFVQLRLSVDPVFGNADDFTLTTVGIPSITPGAVASLAPITVTLPGNLPAGNFYVAVSVDPANDVKEQSESNNVFVSPTASVTVLPATPVSVTPGTLNPRFGTGGIATTTFTTTFTTVDSRTDSQGRLVVAGYTNTGDLFLSRFLDNGSLDLSFGTAGRTITDVRGTTDLAAGLTIDPFTGLIYLAADSASPTSPNDDDFVLARYDATGHLDTTFAANGFSLIDLAPLRGAASSDDRISSISFLVGGKIYLAGSSTITSPTAPSAATTQDFALLRLNPDGSPDTSFNHTGLVTLDFNGGRDSLNAIVLQRDAKIVLAGSTRDASGSPTSFAAARLNTDGSLDRSFGSRGTMTASLRNGDDEAFAVAVQNDGKILLGGLSATGSLADASLTSDFALLRLNSNGRVDSRFGARGAAITPIPDSAVSGINNLAVDAATGKILAAGKTAATLSDALNHNLGAVLVQYNPDGSLDTSFNHSGILQTFTPAPLAPSAPAAPGADLASEFDAFASSSQGLVSITPGGGILALASQQNSAQTSTTVQLASVTSDGVDFTAAVATKGVNASVLSGAKGAAVVTITNAGTLPSSGTVQVKLFLSTDTTLDTTDTAFVTVNLSAKLKAKQSKSFKINFAFPANLPADTYFILADVNTNPDTGPTEINDTNNIAASPSSTTVAPANIDILPTFTGQLPGAFTPGKKQSVTLNLKNNGNTTAKGPATLKLLASPDQSLDATDLLLATLTKNLNLKPGQSLNLSLPFTLAASALPPGADFLAATLQFATDATNNTAFSTTPISAP